MLWNGTDSAQYPMPHHTRFVCEGNILPNQIYSYPMRYLLFNTCHLFTVAEGRGNGGWVDVRPQENKTRNFVSVRVCTSVNQLKIHMFEHRARRANIQRWCMEPGGWWLEWYLSVTIHVPKSPSEVACCRVEINKIANIWFMANILTLSKSVVSHMRSRSRRPERGTHYAVGAVCPGSMILHIVWMVCAIACVCVCVLCVTDHCNSFYSLGRFQSLCSRAPNQAQSGCAEKKRPRKCIYSKRYHAGVASRYYALPSSSHIWTRDETNRISLLLAVSNEYMLPSCSRVAEQDTRQRKRRLNWRHI